MPMWFRRCVFLLPVVFLIACGGKAVKPASNIVWPAPPETPRIQFVKTIASSEDVEEKKWTDHVKAFLFGARSAASLVKPYAVSAASNGRVYVADSGWRKVLVFDESQKKFSMIGVDGPGALSGPLGVATDQSGRVYVTDTVHRKAFVYDPEGKFLFSFGDPNQIEHPVGIAVNDALKRVYIVDTRKHLVLVHDLEGNFLFDFGGRGTEDGKFNFPANLFIDSAGKVYITDMNFRVQIFDPEGQFLSKFGSVGTGFGQFSLPKGVGVDSEGHIYVVDSRFNNVQIFDPSGQLLLFFGEFGGQEGQFWLPAGLAVDQNNRIYVADQYNHRINVFQYLDAPSARSAHPSPEASGSFQFFEEKGAAPAP